MGEFKKGVSTLVKVTICEVCACLCSLEVAEKLQNKCPNKDGNLIAIEIDERKVGHLIDKEVPK